MGNLVWHEYSRYVSLTASVCELSEETDFTIEFCADNQHRYRMG